MTVVEFSVYRINQPKAQVLQPWDEGVPQSRFWRQCWQKVVYLGQVGPPGCGSVWRACPDQTAP